MIAIEYDDVCKQFKHSDTYSVDHVSAKIKEGEFITILGSSGSGKTTLLKLTNRLYEQTDDGRILLFGEDIKDQDPIILRRSIGYVIQQIGLFPHMTIKENIAIIPKLLNWDNAEIDERVRELLLLVSLDPDKYMHRYPSQLSGGQQQRVGLSRALAARPRLMLLDEPFGAIDAITRVNLQNELLRIHGGIRKTFLFVTHDINEAFKLGDRVMIMDKGKLLQFDTPEQIIKHPADDFVESLISSAKQQEKIWQAFS